MIVLVIVALVFIVSIAHHIRSKKEKINLKSLKTHNFRDIFISNRSQHRTPLYYLNQDFTAELLKNNIKNSNWDDVDETKLNIVNKDVKKKLNKKDSKDINQ